MDVVFDELSCDSSLPLSIVGSTFRLTCNGRKRCSVSGDYALAEGQFVLNGVQDSGIENGEVYFSAYIDTESSAFSIRKVMANLCTHAIKENLYNEGDDAYQNGDEGNNGDHENDGDGNNNNQCQLEDGTYYFSAEFSIPEIDSNWVDTGWPSDGQLIMYTYEGEEVGSCQASFRTLSEFGPSSKIVFLVVMPLVGVAFFVLTYFVLRRVISNNPDLCGDDLTCTSEGVTTTAYSVFSDSSSISSDFRRRESKPIRNNPDWCVDELSYNSEGVTTSTYSVVTDNAAKSEGVTTTTFDSAAVSSDSNNSIKCRGSTPISKEGCEKSKTIGGVGDERDEKVKEIKRVKFGVEDKKVEEMKKKCGVEDKTGQKVEEIKRVKIDPPDGIEETMLRRQKKHIGKEVQSSKSPSHLVRMKVSAVNKEPRRSSMQEKCASDNDAQAYSRTEEGNIKSVVVSASSPADKVKGYLLMQLAKRKSAVISTSAAADVTKVHQHIEEAVTKSASSTAEEIKASHHREETNTTSAVVSASSSAHETKWSPLRKDCTETPIISPSSVAYETKAKHFEDEINKKAAVVFASSAAPDVKDYQRMSKDNVKVAFGKNEQAVVTKKNKKIQRMSAVVSTSAAADVTKVHQHIEGAVTKSASSTAEEIKASHHREETNTKSAVVSASSSAHETKWSPLRKDCTETPIISPSSVAHETKAKHLEDEINNKSAVVFASSAAPDVKDYQRMSKDNIKAAFRQNENEQAVVTKKNKKIHRMSADLAAVGGDIAAMGGDMVSSFAAAFSMLTTSQDTEHNHLTHVRNSDRRLASLADDNSSVHAVALGRQALTRCHDISITNSISDSATNSVDTSVAVDWRKKNDKAESPV